MAPKTKTESDQNAAPQPQPEQPRKRKLPPHAWKSGQSGNLKGRPRSGESLSEAVRQHVSPKALIDRMKWLADNAESEMVRYHAVTWLADRGHGKAPLEVVVRKTNPFAKKVKGLTVEQLELLAEIDEVFEEPEADVEPTPGVN